MKRFLALILTIALTCPLAACSEGEIIDITMPASIYSEKTDEELQGEVDQYNCISYTRNDDGSIVYTLTERTHAKILKEIAEEIEDTTKEYLNATNGISAFKDITYNEDFSEFNIYIDPELYNEYFAIYAYAYFVSGVYYQVYNSVPDEDIDVLIKFIDSETNETISHGTYRNLLENY